MKIFKIDTLEVRVAESRAAMGQAAAESVYAAVTAILERKAVVNVMFAAAPSQNEFLAALLRMPVEWSRVNGWHMDEYLGLSADAPQGFGNFLRERLFSQAPFREVFCMDGGGEAGAGVAGDGLAGAGTGGDGMAGAGTGGDGMAGAGTGGDGMAGAGTGGDGMAGARAAAASYASLLKAHPTDIVALGIGENTHLAFNDPPLARFDDPDLVKVVELEEACRRQQVNDGCFDALGSVPKRAMTVTIPGLMRAEYIVGIVPGPRKAEAVALTLTAGVSPRYPATVLRRHPRAVLFLDRDSAAKMRAAGL